MRTDYKHFSSDKTTLSKAFKVCMIVIQKIQSSLRTDNALLTCLFGKLLCNLLTQLVNLTYMSMFSHSQKTFSQNLINQSSNMIVRLIFTLFALLVQCPAEQDVCPPWSIPDNSSNTGFSCSKTCFGGGIKCSPRTDIAYGIVRYQNSSVCIFFFSLNKPNRCS